MTRLKLFTHLLVLWFMTTLLAIGWAWLNMALVETPHWLNVSFGVLVMLLLMSQVRWTAKGFHFPHRRRKILLLIFLVLLFLVGLLWAAQPFIGNLSTRSWLTINDRGNGPVPVLDNRCFSLEGLILSLPQVINIALLPLGRLATVYHSGDFSSTHFTQLILICSAWGGVGLIAAMLLRSALESTQASMSLKARSMPARLLLTSIHPGRWLVRLRRTVLFVAFFAMVPFGLAAWANAQTVQLRWDFHDSDVSAATSHSIGEMEDEALQSLGISRFTILTLLPDARDGVLYAGTLETGILSSRDGGLTWQKANDGLTDNGVLTLARDGERGTLYAGTWQGVFRSFNSGSSWQPAGSGLENTSIRSLALNEQDGTLYAGTWGEGVYRSTDGGVEWEAINVGLESQIVSAVLLDTRNGMLYAGTLGAGVARSADQGASWEETSSDIGNVEVLSLALDRRNGTLYAGTQGAGVFLSRDLGLSWQAVGNEITNNAVMALAVDPRTGTVYAGTTLGVFRRVEDSASWQSLNRGMNSKSTWALAVVDENDPEMRIFAGTSSGVYRLGEDETSWQSACGGSRKTYMKIEALASNPRNGALYTQAAVLEEMILSAGKVTRYVEDGLFESNDGGNEWKRIGTSPGSTEVQSLIFDPQENLLYASTGQTLFQSSNNGVTWAIQPASPLGFQYYNLLSIWDEHGVIGRSPDGSLVWATQGGSSFLTQLVSQLHLQHAAIQLLPNGDSHVVAAYEGTLVRAEIPQDHPRIPLAWFGIRALTWRATTWIGVQSPWLELKLLFWLTLLILILATYIYFTVCKPFGLPASFAFLPSRRSTVPARTGATAIAVETAWPNWERIVRSELLRRGDVTTDDLRSIPAPFRRYALARYADTYIKVQALHFESDHLRLVPAGRRSRSWAWLEHWESAWNAISRELATERVLTLNGREVVGSLAEVLIEALALEHDKVHDSDIARVYVVDAPASRLRLPSRFPIIFLAALETTDQTIRDLVDILTTVQTGGYFALVVPLQAHEAKSSMPMELRRAADRSPVVHDFIVLSSDDIQEMLIAHHPIELFEELVLEQVDLTVVSPFIIRGPVAERMFFGREGEVKTLVEGASMSDFAIVGNRKVGKTSLLMRANDRFAATGRVRSLMVDCQTVHDTNSFFADFQAQTKVTLPNLSPEGFRSALTDLYVHEQPVVLLLDEVDKLLAYEKSHDESLGTTWRALAHAGICHFVFCGSTELARQLDDPLSVFFNFPQPIQLKYLSQTTARAVLTQPLETLGIVMEDEDRILSKMWDLTSGHPNLIQFVGQGLVNAANRRRERRVLPDDLVRLSSSTEFSEFYINTVWGAAGPLERLITMIAPSDNFMTRELESALSKRGVEIGEEALSAALKLLRVYAILDRQDRVYTFVPRAFREILCRSQDVDRLITLEKRHLARGDA